MTVICKAYPVVCVAVVCVDGRVIGISLMILVRRVCWNIRAKTFSSFIIMTFFMALPFDSVSIL